MNIIVDLDDIKNERYFSNNADGFVDYENLSENYHILMCDEK